MMKPKLLNYNFLFKKCNDCSQSYQSYLYTNKYNFMNLAIIKANIILLIKSWVIFVRTSFNLVRLKRKNSILGRNIKFRVTYRYYNSVKIKPFNNCIWDYAFSMHTLLRFQRIFLLFIYLFFGTMLFRISSETIGDIEMPFGTRILHACQHGKTYFLLT